MEFDWKTEAKVAALTALVTAVIGCAMFGARAALAQPMQRPAVICNCSNGSDGMTTCHRYAVSDAAPVCAPSSASDGDVHAIALLGLFVLSILVMLVTNGEKITAAYRRSEVKIPWEKIWALLSIPGSAFASMLGVWLALKIIAWLSDTQFNANTKAGWYGSVMVLAALIATFSAAIRWPDERGRR